MYVSLIGEDRMEQVNKVFVFRVVLLILVVFFTCNLLFLYLFFEIRLIPTFLFILFYIEEIIANEYNKLFRSAVTTERNKVK